ncbi:hypothetical protein BGZ63DRAFT_100574 [Mariannaea sp. PMI_226]|nr:hypothetical protein BGZ63DRAFT_100574 [Mariannaea sp. PMI_226]
MKLTTITSLLACAISANAFIIGELVYFPGYQCDDGGVTAEIPDAARSGFSTIPGSGAILLNHLDEGCVLLACYAGQSCQGEIVAQPIPLGVCMLSNEKNGGDRGLFDKVIVQC